MANQLKCRDCTFYDPIRADGSHGWCVQKSLYPFKEGPGQRFPTGARRVASTDALAKPVIVRANDVVRACTVSKQNPRRRS